MADVAVPVQRGLTTMPLEYPALPRDIRVTTAAGSHGFQIRRDVPGPGAGRPRVALSHRSPPGRRVSTRSCADEGRERPRLPRHGEGEGGAGDRELQRP